MANPLFSIIMVDYNSGSLARQCLESIEQHSETADFELLLVDNGSSHENSLQLADVSRFSFPVRRIRLQDNTGFGLANNIGMEKARGNYFLLLNSDTYFIDDTLDRLVEYARENKPDLLAPRLLGPDGEPQFNAFPPLPASPVSSALQAALLGNEFYRGYRRLTGRPLHGPTQLPDEIGWLSGACLLVKRSLFEVTGGFDPDFFLYSEEREWIENRIKPHQPKLELREEFRVVHLVQGSDQGGLGERQLCLSNYLYWYKMSRTAFWVYAGLNALNLLSALMVLPVQLARGSQRYRRAHFREARALWQALREVPRYASGFGSRPAPLLVPELERHFRWYKFATASVAEEQVNRHA